MYVARAGVSAVASSSCVSIFVSIRGLQMRFAFVMNYQSGS